LTFYYNFLLGYRISDRISLKAGAGLGLVRTLLNANESNPISKFEIGDAAFPVVFKTELMTAITSKIFLGLSWTSSFKKPMYKVSSGYVDSYYSQFISINLKFCLSNKQSLIQNNKSFLKFSR
jgi:hypothetical protein